MQTGACKLCKKENQQLCDSHYLPKKVYGVMRASQLKSPHPVTVGRTGMKQLSDQLRDYVFCMSCEKRLNDNGERWVLKNIPHDYDAPFPLGTALKALTPSLISKDVDLYDVTGVPAFQMDKLVYFGMSMFWRGAVHDWKTTGGLQAPRVDLCAYEEPIRMFLMEKRPLPSDVVLTVDIWHAKKVLQAGYPPVAAHLPECQRYWFYIPGIIFSLYFGEGVRPDLLRRDATKNVVAVDVPEITSIWELTKARGRPGDLSPKMKEMLDEIARIRSKRIPAN